MDFAAKTKAEVITRLEDSISRLKALPDDKFDYRWYVSKVSNDLKCGTVCCWAGWYPKFYPNVFRYNDTEVRPRTTSVEYIDGSRIMDYALCDYHGIVDSAINVLFYGGQLINHNCKTIIPEIDLEASKEQVLKNANALLSLLKKGGYDYLILLPEILNKYEQD